MRCEWKYHALSVAIPHVLGDKLTTIVKARKLQLGTWSLDHLVTNKQKGSRQLPPEYRAILWKYRAVCSVIVANAAKVRRIAANLG